MFKKNLHLCFFKIKCLPSSFNPPLTLDDDEDDQYYPNNTTTTNNNMFINNDNNNNQPSMVLENFNPIYESHLADFSSTFSTRRFFFSSPGFSNSIMDSSNASSTGDGYKKIVGGGVPIKKDSPDPYSDFRRSMLEMIEARTERDGSSEWEFLHELLLCYLKLNPKSTHKLIIGAFSDVLVSMMSDDGQSCVMDK